MKKIIRTVQVSEGNRIYLLFQNITNTILGIIESILFIRLLLKLFGANAQNGFVELMYNISAFFTKPFNNIFKDIDLQDGRILEINTLIAMLVYALVAYIIITIIIALSDRKVKEQYIDVE